MRAGGIAGGIVAASLMAMAGPVRATEFGNTHADLGYIDTLVALPPPPGFYLRDDVNIQVSGRLNNGNGDPVNLNLGPRGTVGVKFRNTIVADILSFAYVPDVKLPFLNASFGFAAYEYFVNTRAGLTTRLGVPQSVATEKAGFGDPTFVPLFVAFTVPNTNLHVTFSPFEFTPPLGRYSQSEPIGNNPGLNFWSYRPALLFTYLSKGGQEANLNIGASINSQNQATHYKSGDEFYFTYSAQQYFSRSFAVGFGGYYYKQVGDDTQNGRVTNAIPAFDVLAAGPGNRGETFAIGPVVSYNLGPNLLLQAHWDHELFSYNRPQRDQIYVRGTIHF